MRVSFSYVFQQNSDGSYTPRKGVQIGGITMGPGVSFGTGVNFGGFDVAKSVGKDLEIDEQPGLIIIKGVYN